jgi:hypothetical protein
VLDYDVVDCPDCDGSGLRVTIKEHDPCVIREWTRCRGT